MRCGGCLSPVLLLVQSDLICTAFYMDGMHAVKLSICAVDSKTKITQLIYIVPR